MSRQRWHYFVSFTADGSPGNGEYISYSEVENIDDIRTMEAAIAHARGYKWVTVTHWKLFKCEYPTTDLTDSPEDTAPSFTS